MGELKLTNRKDPIVPEEKPMKILEDTSWYKSYCHKCPYLIRVPSFDTDDCAAEPKVAVSCVKPVGEDCLAHSTLVSAVLMRDMYNEVAKKVAATPAPETSIGASTLKRRKKIKKRRRR